MKSAGKWMFPALAVLFFLGSCSQKTPAPGKGGSSAPSGRAGEASGRGGAGKTAGREASKPARPAARPEDFGKHPVVAITTNLWTFEITLDAEKAPQTVRNFLTYCLEGFYEGTVFHRIIPGFVVQGGGKVKGPGGTLRSKSPTHLPVPNEAGNGLTHVRGAVAMARYTDPDSATCQFYVVLKKAPYLDKKRYTVFGKVTKGMDVIDKMAALEIVDPKRGLPRNPPVIEKVVVRKGP